MTDDTLPEETYLGDGASTRFDGWHVVLRAQRRQGVMHVPREDEARFSDHYIALERETYLALRRWIAGNPSLARHFGPIER
jgi:hypothetical protein